MYVVGGAGAGADLETEYSDLALLTDKRQYQPGETARVLVNTSRQGQTVLLSVEGDRIYRTWTIPITRPSTVVDVPTRPEWGPNVTLSACYVRNKKYASAEAPLRVALPNRVVNVSVKSDAAQLLPGATAHYTVTTTDKDNKPVGAEFSLGVVDEAIYALREDDAKAMTRAFYPRRRNLVSTRYSFSIEYLGDTDKAPPKIETRRKFLDTAYWNGQLETDPRTGTAHIAVPLPDNLTTWRATVQAVTGDTAVGRAVGKLVVTKPFFVRLDMPRFLVAGDTVTVLAPVHNETDAPLSAHVKLKAPGLLPPGAGDTQNVSVPAHGVVTAQWQITAGQSGPAPVTVEAWTDGNRYTDGLTQTLPVRVWGREEFSALAGIAGGADAAGGKRDFSLAPGVALPETRLTVRVAPSVAAALTPGLDYVVGYPYGCTEQTLSRFVPDLAVAEIEQRGPVLLRGAAGDKQRRALPHMVQNGLLRLSRLQHGNSGAWGWWETGDDDPALTAYAIYGLALARDRGYPVNGEMLQRGMKAALALKGKTSPNDAPFLLYALARAGERGEAVRGPLQAVNAGDRKAAWGMELKTLAPDALAYLVLAAREAGVDPTPAWNELQRRQVSEGLLMHFANDRYRWKSSDRMATAVALRAYIAMAPGDSRVISLLRYLMASRTDGYWGDTRDTASVLVALCDYLRAYPQEAAPSSGTIAIQVNGQTVGTLDASQSGGDAEYVVRVPASRLRRGSNTLDITRTGGGGGSVFWSAGLTQTVASGGGDLPPVSQNGLTVAREYRPLDDTSPGSATGKAADSFAQGQPVRVHLTIDAAQDVDYVLVEDPYPAGVEVTERGTSEAADVDFSSGGNVSGGTWFEQTDVRDDHIAFFAAHLSKGRHYIDYNLRAQTPGKSRTLPARIQALYAPPFHAETGGAGVTVR